MPETTRDIVVIGASAGGVEALQRLVAGLPADFPATVCVVMHLWPHTQSFLPQILDRSGPLPAKTAEDRETFKRGIIYVAPADLHLFMGARTFAVLRGPKENRARPAVNPLFRSAATAHRQRVIGVILSGTLDDGAAGLWAIKQCGGLAVVQSDPQFGEMARSALENVAVDHHVRLGEMPALLDRLVRENVLASNVQVPAVVIANDQGAKMNNANMDIDKIGRRALFTCPECNGALWELDEGKLQYRCHVGHAFSADVLHEMQSATIEASLWSALRALKESAALDERLARRSTEFKLHEAAQIHTRTAQQKHAQAQHLETYFQSLRAETSEADPLPP